MTISEELQSIYDEKGILKPSDVVEFAKDPSTRLHSRFEWDDTKAAHQHRLWQAREIIRVTVTIIEKHTEPIRAYVSLMPNRQERDGGYYAIATVLSDREKYEQMLRDALDEFTVFEKKYRAIKELKPLFEAARRVRSRRSRAKEPVTV